MYSKVEKIMKEKNISQYELAKRMNVPTSTITELKKGRIKKPSFDLMQKIAEALDTSLDEFRYKKEEKQ
ncbi:XRE family transcriptional regulator [Listeria monocytogenes]|nr:XRE family transcriptional regulator [Listeria monocytogenes]